jgi:hypothetical protein
MSPSVNSSILLSLFLLLSSFSIMEFQYEFIYSFCAEIKFGKESAVVSLSNISNYVKPNYHSIYCRKSINDRGRIKEELIIFTFKLVRLLFYLWIYLTIIIISLE